MTVPGVQPSLSAALFDGVERPVTVDEDHRLFIMLAGPETGFDESIVGGLRQVFSGCVGLCRHRHPHKGGMAGLYAGALGNPGGLHLPGHPRRSGRPSSPRRMMGRPEGTHGTAEPIPLESTAMPSRPAVLP